MMNYDQEEIADLKKLVNESREIIRETIPIIQAFLDIMDATSIDKLQEMTGIQTERCEEIYEIYKKCLEKK